MKEVHRNNLMEALAAVEAQAETRFSLNFYRGAGPYGPAYCTAGIVAYLPCFRAQGVYAHGEHGGPVMGGPDGKPLDPRSTLVQLFGPFARDGLALFAMYGQGAWDVTLFGAAVALPSHKALALLRFHHVLDLVGAEEREQSLQASGPVSTAKRARKLAA